MADNFNFGQLTKEIVSGRLKDVADVPSVTAEIVRKTIVAGVKATAASGQAPRDTVEQVCRGAMSGLILIDKDLPQAAVAILDKMPEVSNETQLDPGDLMTWAMAGISRIAPIVSKQVQWQIRDAINQKYMGAGDVFDKLCEQTNPAKT